MIINNQFEHRIDICDDEFYEIIRSLKNDHNRYKKHLEPLLSGNVRKNIVDKCRKICDVISTIKKYKKGMWVTIVHRPDAKLDAGKVFLVFNQCLDFSLDISKDRKGRTAREETYIFGTSQTLPGNELYFNGFSELVMKHSNDSFKDGTVVK
jgi:hypothetical protein